MNIETPFRKHRILPNAQVPPLSQLKRRSPEDRQWAFHLGDSVCAVDAIKEIKAKLGIDLKWTSTYTRFCQWQAHQESLEVLEGSLQQIEGICAQGDPSATLQSVRTLAMAVLLNEAFKAKRVDIFAALNRQWLAQEKLSLDQRKTNLREKTIAERAAHNAQKIELRPQDDAPLACQSELEATHG